MLLIGLRIFIRLYRLKKNKVALIATAPLVVKFHLEPIIEKLKIEYDVVVLTNLSSQDENNFLDILPDGVRYIDSKMERKISPFSDFKSLLILLRFFMKEDVDIALTLSPKAGLLGSFSSLIGRVPVRIHAFTGQVWQTKVGGLRTLLRWMDKLIYLYSSKVLVDSHSQRQFLIDNNVVSEEGSLVLGDGSLVGVNIAKFSHDPLVREKFRENAGVACDTKVFLFVGRLDREKGIAELLKAFSSMNKKLSRTALWIVGPNETDLGEFDESLDTFSSKSVKFFPYTPNPEVYMMAADVFCLSSYREGFGTVIIESAACGIPSIGSDISGLSDSIVNNKTGLLVNVGDICSLSAAMIKLAEDDSLRMMLGEQAMLRAQEKFDQRIVVSRLVEFLNTELDEYVQSQ